jgi:hypothetical protein
MPSYTDRGAAIFDADELTRFGALIDDLETEARLATEILDGIQGSHPSRSPVRCRDGRSVEACAR